MARLRHAPLFASAALVGVAAGRFAFQALHTVERSSWPPSDPSIAADDAAAATLRFVEQRLGPHDVGLAYAPGTAATIEPYVEGREFYPRILDDLRAATTSIHILMFGWKPGDVADRFVEVVTDRLNAGVEVRVLVDSFGSRPYGGSRGMFTELVEAGAAIVVNDLLPPDRDGEYPNGSIDWSMDEVGRSDHRKLFVVDGRTMWTGGAGIEDHFENGEFHDVMVRLTGDVVRQAQAVFLTSFAGHGGRLGGDLDTYFPPPLRRGEVPATLGQVVPGGHVSATHAARELIDEASERVDIMNPYLTDSDMIGRIEAASRRGVLVRIVVSETSNNALASAALRAHYTRLHAAGVEIWEYPGAVVHAKVIVADDRVQFGTLNLDAWALYRNFEVAVVARSAAVVQRFEEQLFEPDIERSRPGSAPDALAARAFGRIGRAVSFVL